MPGTETFRARLRRTTRMSKAPRIIPPLFVATLGLLALSLASCANERGRDRDFAGPPAGQAPVPELEGHAAFLQGGLAVDVLLNRAGFASRGEAGAGESDRSSRGGGGGFRDGFGGGRGRRGGARGGDEGGRAGGGDGEAPAAHIRASNQPPVRLHLRFKNHGDAPLTVEVPRFDSDLGNFVVQPARITVAPHMAAEADPMTSTLGVLSTEVPVTIEIRVNGATEHQVLMLHLKAPAEPPPPPATP